MLMAGFELLVSVGLWFLRAFISSIICLFIGYIGIRSITLFTTRIKEFEIIKGDPIATGLFVGGFFVYAGLAIYGSMVNPFFLSQSVIIGAYLNAHRILMVVSSFFVSLFFGILFYLVFAKLELFNVDLDDINKSPLAVGIFIFCYEVFLGLLIFASLTIPIG